MWFKKVRLVEMTKQISRRRDTKRLSPGSLQCLVQRDEGSQAEEAGKEHSRREEGGRCGTQARGEGRSVECCRVVSALGSDLSLRELSGLILVTYSLRQCWFVVFERICVKHLADVYYASLLLLITIIVADTWCLVPGVSFCSVLLLPLLPFPS